MTRRLLFLALVGALLSSAVAIARAGEKKVASPAIKSIASDKATKAIVPYSQAVVAGGFFFAA